jgi:hypothetical protein
MSTVIFIARYSSLSNALLFFLDSLHNRFLTDQFFTLLKIKRKIWVWSPVAHYFPSGINPLVNTQGKR